MPNNTLPDLPLFLAKISDSKAFLSQEEGNHLSKVMRKKQGDKVLVTNGKGTMAKAIVSIISKKETTLEITDVLQSEKDKKVVPKLTLAISLLKNNSRFEFLLEKCVELGIDSIQPFISSRTIRTKYNADRYEKIIHAASKQSRKSYFTNLLACVSFDDLIHSFKCLDHYSLH